MKFESSLMDFLSGSLKPTDTIVVGKVPNVLQLIGAKSENIIINQSVVRNCLNDENTISHNHSSGHNLPLEVLRQIPESLRNPILICSGSKANTVVAITELLNRNNKNVFIPIAIDVNGKQGKVSKILSAYGKDNIEVYLHRANILAYNKEKASKLFTDIGANSPQSTSIACYYNSIAYTTANVKAVENKIYERKEKGMSKENDYVTAAPPELNEIGDAPKVYGQMANAPRRIEKDFTCRGWQRGSGGYTHESVVDSEIFLDTDSGQMDEMDDVISMSEDQFAEYLWKWSDEYFGPDSRENFVKTATNEENTGYEDCYSFTYYDVDDDFSFIGASPEVSMSDIVSHIGKSFPEELAEYECTFDDNQGNGRK